MNAMYQRRASTAIVALTITAMAIQSAWSQTRAGLVRITVQVPADARVIINGHETRSTGASRRYISRGLVAGRSYVYRVRVVGQYRGKPWLREQTVELRADETKELIFRYSDPAERVTRRIPTTDSDSLASATGRAEEPDVAVPSDPPRIPLPKVPHAVADQAYYAIPLEKLLLPEGNLPPEYLSENDRAEVGDSLGPWATVDDGGEAYVDIASPNQWTLLLCTKRTDKITGQLWLPSTSAQRTVQLTYAVPADAATGTAKQHFFRAKYKHFRERLTIDSAGSAWFRHRLWAAESQLRRTGAWASVSRSEPPPEGDHQLMKWYALLTGGRAIIENLDLQAYQASMVSGGSTFPVKAIRGITVPAINWQPLLPDQPPALDLLASSIPADQHSVFFPSAQQARDLAEQATAGETVFLRLADPRTEHGRIRTRYEQQFGLPLDELVALLSPDLAGSIAVTGSAPLIALGTDVAILIESPQPAVLGQQLLEQIAAGARRWDDVERQTWDSPALKAVGVRSADRRICSYVAMLPQAVVLTNSEYQLQQLSEVRMGDKPSLASAPEFTFFRDRYRLGDADETALVVISDATIRRWGSPRWRIGQARRLAAAAALADWQARWLDRPPTAADSGQTQTVAADVALPDDLKLSSRGAWSPVYGSLEFMTPVAELPMGRATAAEKKAYEAWRNKYQRNWVRFDPIAMQFSLDGEQLDVDVTVAPLTIQTKYAYVQSLTQGVRLPATAGDPHDALAELAVALNRNSRFFQMARLVAQSAFQQVGDRMSGTDPLAWFAGTITAYVDPDPNWKNVAAVFCDPASRENMTDAQWAVLARAPIGVQFEVSSGLELTKFLVAARSVLESTAPGMLDWQLCEHQGEHYTKLTLSEIAKDRNRGKDVTLARAIESAGIYYTTSGEALIISPNEDVLRRALDRRIARREQAGESLPTEPREWLGDSLAVQIDGDLLQWIVDIAGEHHYQSYMRRRSWSNLPILNEWKRRYPDQDPVASHERLWHVRPVCPGGGQYVWNANWQTMESTVYGHPSAPKKGPDMPDALRRLRAAKAGLTFEDNGLRARFSLSLTSPDRS